MEITAQTKLFDVLEAYPALESQIINIAPPFKNLQNPVLRRTVGKLANLEQVAKIGGMDVDKLVNTLRRAVGQEELSAASEGTISVDVSIDANDPPWISEKPGVVVNGTELLANGEVPLGHINDLLAKIPPGSVILLVTEFFPSPIIDAMKKQDRMVHHKVDAKNPLRHLTFIR